MKNVLMSFAITLAVASHASAATIIFGDCDENCNGFTGMAMLFSLNGGNVDVEFRSTLPFGDNAVGFNIAGPTEGLTISNLTGGYTVGGTNATIGPFGSFEFLIDGPDSGGLTNPWFFTLSRDAGFFDELGVFERNAAGYFAAANILTGPNFDETATVGAGVLLADIAPTPVPEPGSMLLLATGLAAAWRARRHTSC